MSKGVSRIKQRDYLPAGDYPVVDQGQELFAGYSNRDDGLFSDVPVIVFGDHTRHVKYVDRPFFVGADGVKILKPRLSNNVRYWYHALRNTHLENLGYSRHFKLLKQATFCVPDEEAQRMVCDELDGIFELIKLARRQLSLLDELVKSRFVEMFGDSDIAFERLDDVAEVQGGLTKNRRRESLGLKLPYLRVANVLPNSIDLSEVKVIGLTEQECMAKRLKPGDLLIVEGNGSGEQIGRSAIWNGEIEPCTHQNHLIRVRFGEKVLPVFAQAYLSSSHGRGQIVSKAVNTSGLYTLSTGKIRSLIIPVPPLSLQCEFAAFAAEVAKSQFVSRAVRDVLYCYVRETSSTAEREDVSASPQTD